jgi:hypothetical protein
MITYCVINAKRYQPEMATKIASEVVGGANYTGGTPLHKR